jgi:hypothetical protein
MVRRDTAILMAKIWCAYVIEVFLHGTRRTSNTTSMHPALGRLCREADKARKRANALAVKWVCDHCDVRERAPNRRSIK